MPTKQYKGILIWFSFAITAIVLLSLIARVPYIYSILGLCIWIFVGHLVTLDDEAPDGFSNPDNSKEIWLSSKKELAIKLLVLICLLTVIFLFPSLKEYGA